MNKFIKFFIVPVLIGVLLGLGSVKAAKRYKQLPDPLEFIQTNCFWQFLSGSGGSGGLEFTWEVFNNTKNHFPYIEAQVPLRCYQGTNGVGCTGCVYMWVYSITYKNNMPVYTFYDSVSRSKSDACGSGDDYAILDYTLPNNGQFSFYCGFYNCAPNDCTKPGNVEYIFSTTQVNLVNGVFN